MKISETYKKQICALLSPAQCRVVGKLSTPKKIQDFLESFPVHFPTVGQGMLAPQSVLLQRKAHCMEGAVFAAMALAYHGKPPLLMDFQTTPNDEDHVIALFKEPTGWGAISKTNHPVLRWRDPIYRTVRELAMSYAHEYFLWSKKDGKQVGKKTLRAYSKPFDLRRYAPERWVPATATIDWLAEPLDDSPHFPIASRLAVQKLRKATKIEIKAMQLEEWQKPRL